MVMKAKLIAASAALAFVLGTSAPALAVDCNTSVDGIQPPGDLISSATNNGTVSTSPFVTLVATAAASSGTTVTADEQPGIGGDMQNAFAVLCDIGSKSDPSTMTSVMPSVTTLP
jgi:hypothetical protein